MDLGLRGKRALITGSNTGIGKGIARALAAEGVLVVIHGRDRERAEKTACALIGDGARAESIAGDLSTSEGAAGVIDEALSRGPVDILVNNAGGAAGGAMSEWFSTTDEVWERTFQINVMSAVRMIRALVPPMQERGWGRVINIGSTSATMPNAEIADYQAAKAAMLNLTVSLSKRLAGTGVTANMVSPGPVLTPAPRHWLQSLARERGDETIDAVAAEIARDDYGVTVGRWGTTDEIGTVVAMLASPRSDFTTGANFHIDGGAAQAIH